MGNPVTCLAMAPSGFPLPCPPYDYSAASATAGGDGQHLQAWSSGIRTSGGGSRVLRAPSARVSSEKSTSIASLKLTSSPSSSVAGFQNDCESSSASASDVVMAFYAGINGRDLTSVEKLIAENCVYEDLIFARPFTGRQAILNFFQKFINSISKDLQFVIDGISKEDSSTIGVTWHLEWQGKTFPFSKGCSLYQLELSNGRKHIIYGRDIVEPFIKPGEIALAAISGVVWLLEKFPWLANQLEKGDVELERQAKN